MTEDEALIWIDFYQWRLFGWDIVAGIDPKTGRSDGRTRHHREAGEVMRDWIINHPKFDAWMECLQNEGDLAALWPEAFHEMIRFRLDHKVPRDWNEPSSERCRADRRESWGEDWPEQCLAHGLPAEPGDHPPFPPRSELYLAIDFDHQRRRKLRVVKGGRA